MTSRLGRHVAKLACAALLATGLGVVIPASPASAASPYCNTYAGRNVRPGVYVYLPYSTASSTSTCVMARGAQGNHVVALQWALVYCYSLDTGGFDGIFGSKTYSALRTAQSREGIGVDGVYGPQTRSALLWPTYQVHGEFPYRPCTNI
jgi:peptidoglycan hydrolase-like protein with peptidoglycan-binding domain